MLCVTFWGMTRLFLSGCPTLHPHQQRTRVPTSAQPPQHLLFFFPPLKKIIAILVDVEWYLVCLFYVFVFSVGQWFQKAAVYQWGVEDGEGSAVWGWGGSSIIASDGPNDPSRRHCYLYHRIASERLDDSLMWILTREGIC